MGGGDFIELKGKMQINVLFLLLFQILQPVCCHINFFTNNGFLLKHRESVVAHQNNKRYLGDTTLALTSSDGKEVSKATVREEKITIPTYEMDSDNPYPVFPAISGRNDIYPYPLKDSHSFRKVNKQYTILILENEYLKVTVLPDLGGHLYQFYDKIKKRDIVYTNHVIKPGYFGLRGGWCSGGFEFNFPHAHSLTTISPVDYAIRENPDGSASIVVSDIEKVYGMKWQVILTLYPNKSYLEQEVQLYNRTLLPHRYHWWTIVAMPATKESQVIYPIRRVTDDAQTYVYTWPIWLGRDISWYKNLFSGTSWFQYHKPFESFFSYYNHGIDSGLCHVSEPDVCPWSKWFTYGPSDEGRYFSAYVMSDEDGPYDEVDSGLFKTQQDFRIFQPLDVIHWKEYWYPINQLKDIVKANRDGAIGVTKLSNNTTIRLNVNFELKNGKINIQVDEKKVTEIVSLKPGEVYSKQIEGTGVVSIVLEKDKGKEILSYLEKPIDENMLPPEGPVQKERKEMDAKEFYLAGLKELEAEEPLKAREYFESALKKAPNLKDAHTQIGVIYLKQGLWKEAKAEFEKEIEKQLNNERHLSDTTLGDVYYYLGLVNKIIGNLPAAEDYLLKATKFPQTSPIAYHCLGQISLTRGNYHQAVKHFKKALERNSRSSETRVLLSAAYRKMQKYIDAEKMIKSVFEDEPTNYFAAFEQYLVSKDKKETLSDMSYQNFSRLIRDEEQSYMELACLYINSGLYKDAITLMEMIDGEKSPMSLFYLGYLYNKIGKREKGKEFYGNVLKAKNYQYLFPNRLEEFAILQDAIEESQDDFLARYAMGNLLASRYRFSEALEQWSKSAQKIENLKNEEKTQFSDCLTVLYRNIGLMLWKIQKKHEEAVSWYEKALSYGRLHFQCYKELSDLYGEMNHNEKRIAVLESGIKRVTKPSELVRILLPLYFEKENFKRMEEIISQYPADHLHRFEFQSWHRAIHLTKGKKLFDEGKFSEAISEFDRAMEYPENIRITKEPLHNFAEILWYKGLAYSKMNNLPEAFRCWSQAADEAYGALEMNRLYQAKILKKLSEILLDEMISMADSNIKMHPEEEANPWFANLYFLQGLAYEEKGHIEKAINSYKKALELNSEHLQAKERLQKLEK